MLESIEASANPNTLLKNLLLDIEIENEGTYWTPSDLEEFMQIMRSYGARRLLGWLLGINNSQVMEYLKYVGQDVDEDLPYWMTKFRPSYTAYTTLVNSLEDPPADDEVPDPIDSQLWHLLDDMDELPPTPEELAEVEKTFGELINE